jgi:hypothetical protein
MLDFNAFDLAELFRLLVHAAADDRAHGRARCGADDRARAVVAGLVADDRAGDRAGDRADGRAAFGPAVRIFVSGGGAGVVRGRAGEGEERDQDQDQGFTKH